MSRIIDNTSKRSVDRQALLAQWLKHRAADQTRRSDLIPRRPDDCVVPLSFEQSRLWFFYQLDRLSPLYTMPIGMRLRGSLNVQALQKALDCVVARHEALRTRFLIDTAVQVVSEPSTAPIHLVDLRGTPTSTREAEAVRILESEARRPFNLENDLMVRGALVRLDEDEWLFLVLMHHIASDDWSWRVFCRELTQFYEAAVSDRSLSLPKPALQYGDFAVWQRDWAKSAALNDHLAYWRQLLNGAPTVLELPTDHPRPATQSFRGGNEWRTLSVDLNKKAEALSQSAGATVFTILLAAFQILIFRYTRQETMLIGSPAAGRTRSELEDVIGVFVNMLIFRGDLSGDPTVKEFLGQLQGKVLESLSRQDLPFEKLVEELQPARSLSYSPLVQVMFAFQDELSENLQLSGLKVLPFQVDTGTAKFDLTLTIMKSEAGLNCCAEYSSDLFEPQSIRRLLEHYETLLNGIVSGGLNQHLSELPILSSVERRQLLEEWNSTETDFPRNATLHELFSAEAKETPAAPALTFNGTTLTYDELDRASNQLARHLRSLNLGSESLVAVCMNRSLEMVIALLATLKAGAAYVPVDPMYPSERIRFMLDDSQAAAVLTLSGQKPHIENLRLSAVPMICVDSDWPLISKQPSDAIACEATAESLAYVIYTSGSTGQPKGTMIPHRAVTNLLYAMKRDPGFRREDTLLSVTSISFDIAALEIFLPLISGGQVVLADSDTIFNGARLIQLIARSKATVMQATPSLWKFLVDSDWQGQRELRIFCGGEKLTRTLADQLLTRGSELWNLYGPTETTIWSMVSRIVPGPEPISIGRPVSNTQIYLLDDRLQPVPIGIPGELHIAGDGVARGYLRCPELTHAKFISNPFDKTRRFTRLYKTGDIARYQRDGTIEWLARADHEIKLRGHRIDPGEIEATLRKHPDIREALVMAHDADHEQKELIAYLVCGAASPNRDEVKQLLAQKLPDYMIPTSIVLLDHFPLTPNGKINRNALPRPTQSSTNQPSPSPRTSMETALTAVWQEVLQREQVGVDDDFFRMGGHSLLAMQMASRIRKALHVDISLRDLFENPTIASLAKCIEGKEIPPNTDAVPKHSTISAQHARSLLDKLEDISDEEVEALLHQLSPPEGKL